MRAICILLVVLAHAVNPGLYPRLFSFVGHLGNYGVRIFFLISGFLITEILLKEFNRTGTISLKDFYMRRVIRIFPAFYAYVAVVFVLAQLNVIQLLPGDMLHTLTYTMNYHYDRSWYVNHTWSLSVEEQFYLLWPAVLLFAGPRKALKVSVAVIFIVPVIRMIMYVGFSAGPTALSRNFQAVCDALATGCLLAGMYSRLGQWEFYRKAQRSWWYIGVPTSLIVLSAVTFRLGEGFYYLIGQSIANLGGVLLLDYAVRVPTSSFGTVLNMRPLAMIGVWSYSIYLWQELFLDMSPTGMDLHWPLNIICLTVVSLVAYYCVEKQFMKLRKYFSGERSRRPVTAAAVSVGGPAEPA